jgi:hypothetical protein
MQQLLAYIFQTMSQHEVFVITPTLNAGYRCSRHVSHGNTQPRPRPLLGWLWQVSLAGLVNFGLAFGNYRNGFSCEKALNIKKTIKIEGLGLGWATR